MLECFERSSEAAFELKAVGRDSHRNTGLAVGASWSIKIDTTASETGQIQQRQQLNIGFNVRVKVVVIGLAVVKVPTGVRMGGSDNGDASHVSGPE